MADSANSKYAFSDPLASGQSGQAPVPAAIDYTAWDYDSIKSMLIDLAKRKFPNTWNNLTEHDFGVLLIEFMAFVSDAQSFKLDYYLGESFYATAILDKSIRRHARGLGYKPRPRRASRFEFVASVQEPFSVDITIEPGRRISTSAKDGQGLFCELYLADDFGDPIEDKPIVIPAGTTHFSKIVGIEGESSSIDTSGDGTPFQKIKIEDNNVIPTSIRVYVDGVEWSQVDAIVEMGPRPVFRIDQDDRTNQYFVVSGDGIRGAVFPETGTVLISYRKGGGERGNVPAGYFLASQNVRVPEAKLGAPISFTNRTPGRGGDDGETAEEIRLGMPIWFASQNRLVTLEDYNFFASNFASDNAGRVAKARAYLARAGCSANIINVYVLEYVSRAEVDIPSDKLLKRLSEAIDAKKMVTQHVCVKPGQAVFVDVQVHARSSNITSSRRPEVERQLRNAVAGFFELSNWTFGKQFSTSALHRYLGSTREVEEFIISAVMDPGYDIVEGTYATRDWELIRPRTIEVSLEVMA